MQNFKVTAQIESASPFRDGDQEKAITIAVVDASSDDTYDSLSDQTLTGTNKDIHRLVFLTTQSHDGNFGGLAGADNFCKYGSNNRRKFFE